MEVSERKKGLKTRRIIFGVEIEIVNKDQSCLQM